MNEGLDWSLPGAPKIILPGPSGLAGRCQNRYIDGNLWFSYDRVLRVGPSGPALFYYLNASGRPGCRLGRTAGLVRPG
jgi:hypothetical protein